LGAAPKVELTLSAFDIVAYLGIGMIAGLAAGLFGVGGGIIIVPALAWLLPYTDIPQGVLMHTAIATSLAIMIPTAFSSSLKHYQQGNVDVDILKRLGIGIFIGSIIGVLIANRLQTDALRMIFAVFELLVALQMLASKDTPSLSSSHSLRELPLIGTAIGGLSSLLGIGGGTMTVPYLNWRGINMRVAIASSAACSLIIAITGAVVFATTGAHSDGDLQLGYIYLPVAVTIALASIVTARLGANLSTRLPIPLLKKLFAFLLIAVAIKMML
jgi:uncharacterized membrane protein YfcA